IMRLYAPRSLSLHDALPISVPGVETRLRIPGLPNREGHLHSSLEQRSLTREHFRLHASARLSNIWRNLPWVNRKLPCRRSGTPRTEEDTSELQSPDQLVCLL